MSSNSLESTLNDAQSQIRELRSQLNKLMDDRVEPAMADYAKRAGKVYDRAGRASREQAEVASDYVRERPITIVLAAAAIGYIVARLTR